MLGAVASVIPCIFRSADTHDVRSQTDPKTRYQRLLDLLISVLLVPQATRQVGKTVVNEQPRRFP